jgi:hypothetical protein
LAKCGVGVALTGSVLLVLWEMQGRTEQETFYRIATQRVKILGIMPAPSDWFQEHEVVVMGMMAVPPRPMVAPKFDGQRSDASPPHVDLKLDPVEVDRLIDQSQSTQHLPGQSPPDKSGSP